MSRKATEQERTREAGSVTNGEVRDDSGRILCWARRPFQYNGTSLDRGQVFGMIGARLDEKLIRLGYVLTLLPGDRPLICRACGARFINLDTLNAHGAKRHAAKAGAGLDVPFSPKGATVDETAAAVQAKEREQTLADQLAPLNLDKTEASTRG